MERRLITMLAMTLGIAVCFVVSWGLAADPPRTDSLQASDKTLARFSGIAFDVGIATAKDMAPLAALVEKNHGKADSGDEYIVIRIVKFAECEGSIKFMGTLIASDKAVNRINVNLGWTRRLGVGEAMYVILSANEAIPDPAAREKAKNATWKVVPHVLD